MNLQLIILAALVSAAAAGWLGYDYGTSKVEADQAREERVIRVVSAAAAASAAEAVANVKVRTTVVRGEIERELRTNTVYVECKHSDVQLQHLNEALTGERAAVPPSDGPLPPIDSPD